MSAGAVPEHIVEQRGMGISQGDFDRIFPRVVVGATIVRDGLRVRAEWEGGKRLQIFLSEEKVRKLGRLQLPYLDLKFRFENFAESERDAFLERFHRAFQKGGG